MTSSTLSPVAGPEYEREVSVVQFMNTELRREWLRFAGVGVVNTLIYYVGFRALHRLLPYLAAHALAFAICIVVSFFLNCAFTFHVTPTWRRFIRFPLSTLTTFIVMTVGVSVLVEKLGADPDSAALITALVAVPVSYVISRMLLVGSLRH
jgi:putative flippase GtrA